MGEKGKPENRRKQANRGSFKPGKSGNPGGRPKESKAFRDWCRNLMEEKGWGILAEMVQAEGRDQMKALELVMAYAYGKPTQSHEVSTTEDKTIRLEWGDAGADSES